MRNNNENSVRKRCTQPFSFSIEGANVFVLPCAIFNAWHIVRGARVDSYMRQWHTGTMLRNFTTELQTILCAPQYLQFSDAFGTVSASRAYCSQAMWREREREREIWIFRIFSTPRSHGTLVITHSTWSPVFIVQREFEFPCECYEEAVSEIGIITNLEGGVGLMAMEWEHFRTTELPNYDQLLWVGENDRKNIFRFHSLISFDMPSIASPFSLALSCSLRVPQ